MLSVEMARVLRTKSDPFVKFKISQISLASWLTKVMITTPSVAAERPQGTPRRSLVAQPSNSNSAMLAAMRVHEGHFSHCTS